MAALRRCMTKLRINSLRYALYQSGLTQKDIPRPLTNCHSDVSHQHIHPASFAITNFCRTCSTYTRSKNTYSVLRLENMPRLISKDDMETFLGKYGAIDCQKQGITAMVKFSKPEMVALAADNLDGIVFGGCTMKATIGGNKSKLRILNVPEGWETEELKQLCKPYGEVLETSMKSDWLVNFGSLKEMDAAANVLQGSTYDNTVIKAKPWKPESRQKGAGPYEVFKQSDYQLGNINNMHDTMADSDETDELYSKIVLEVKGHDVAVLNSYAAFVKMTTRFLNINLVRIYTPPKVITKYTLLKSVHIYSKHRVQYEMRTNYRVIELEKLTGSTANTFLEYIERNLPAGVAMKVTKHELQKLPEHMAPPLEEITA
ncbi:uncharacterized protein LOC117323695 [Pecten maximus]|uniref:uncharacterized protein LOC117323695 n=1 Tax=Pecten maximus TaxID=6579 RepID=UPI0014586976|nr:uncharacterized protein LOC117323695 [Pecten maximus]